MEPFKCNSRQEYFKEGYGILSQARCCLSGNYQKVYRDVDSDQLYAPVVMHQTIRMFIKDVAALLLLRNLMLKMLI